MSTTHKNSPAGVGSNSRGNELSTGSKNHSTPAPHGKKLTFHMIVNIDDVRRGEDHVLRTLCGKRIPLLTATRKRGKSAVKAEPNHSFCQPCNDLYDLELEIGL